MNRQPLSEQPGQTRAFRYFFAAFGSIFLIAGCLLLWFLGIQPLRQLLNARSWTAAECKVIQSTIESKNDSDGRTYQPKIRYEYRVAGKRYTSTRYSFFPIWSNRGRAETIVAEYKTGTNHPCFYDPAKPDEAVLKRDFASLGLWVGVLFPWPFILGGGGVMFLGLRKTHSQPTFTSTSEQASSDKLLVRDAEQSSFAPRWGEYRDEQTPGDSLADAKTLRAAPVPYSERANWQKFTGPQKLLPIGSRIGAVIALGCVALFWNTIVGLLTVPALGRRQWFQLLFMTPFVLAGLGLIAGFVYCFLRLFNPTVELAISEGAVPLGDAFDVAWELKGRVSRIRELTISAIGEEEATYTRGTDTRTEKRVFQTIEIIRTSAVSDMQFGTANVTIPLDTMHSHSGDKNKITWKLTVHGDIPFFPHVLEEFEFRVIPRGAA